MPVSRFLPSRQIPPRTLRWLAVFALAIGLAMSLAGGAAADTCGHYVKRLGPGFVPGKAAAEQVAAESHSMPDSTPCPCRGPECGRSPHDQTPFSPSTPVRLHAPPELITIAVRSFELRLGSSGLVGDSFGRPSRGYPLGKIRPPSV